eukprot:9480896-Pyramimonas_sp.AAC.1
MSLDGDGCAEEAAPLPVEYIPTASHPDIMFFQITCKYPKKIAADSAEGLFNTGDIVVSALKMKSTVTELEYYLVGDGKDTDRGRILTWRSLMECMDEICRCPPSGLLFYTLRGISGHDEVRVSDALALLLESQALESAMTDASLTISSDDGDVEDTLKFMLAHGIVERLVDTPTSSSWRITLVGEDMVEACTRLHPDDFEKIAVPREDIDIKSMTQFELIHYLRNIGWIGSVWHTTASDSRPPPVMVENGGPKIWYVKKASVCISKAYLLAMARMDEAKVETIEHFRQDKYYNGLFKVSKLSFRSDEIGIDLE